MYAKIDVDVSANQTALSADALNAAMQEFKDGVNWDADSEGGDA